MIQIKTLGCRLNSYESEVIKTLLYNAKLYDCTMINTCTITNEANRKSKQAIRQEKKTNPNNIIIVTGCASEAEKKQYTSMPEVDFVVENKSKLNQSSYDEIYKIVSKEKESDSNFISSKVNSDRSTIHQFTGFSRGYVKVQDGCNHYCSFCIVPFTRGKMRSTPQENIIENINNLTKSGYNEVVLTGVDITDYGTDLKNENITLGMLCKQIIRQTTLPRLRLSSVDVSEIDEDIIDLLANEPRFMPYFHISMQSANDDVLKSMRRRHRHKDIINFCTKARQLRPDVAFGADLIAGFCQESYEMFQDSLNIISDVGISYVHAFPYSTKEKTLGARMVDDVPKSEKKHRVDQLIRAGKLEYEKTMNSMLGRDFKCVVEFGNKLRAENFMQIKLDTTSSQSARISPKSLIDVRCVEIKDGSLIARVI